MFHLGGGKITVKNLKIYPQKHSTSQKNAYWIKKSAERFNLKRVAILQECSLYK